MPPFVPHFFNRRAIRVAASALVVALYLFGFFEKAELISIDFRYRFGQSAPNPDLLLALIDQQSLKEFNQWPWPRQFYADVISKLKQSGARLIALDMDFSARASGPGDEALVRAVESAGNVVLAAFYDERILPGGLKLRSANLPFPELQSAAAGIGSILFPVDPDGTMRRAYLENNIQGHAMRSLVAEIARHSPGLTPEQTGGQRPVRDRGGDFKISTRPDGTYYIRFAGPADSFPAVSFADILQGRFDASVVRDKIVIVGASAMELRDIWNTPFGLMPGVEIHANALQSVLSPPAVKRAPAWISLVLIAAWILLLELPMTQKIYREGTRLLRRFLLLTGLSLGMFLALLLGSVFLFASQGILIDTIPVAAGLLVHFLFTSFEFNMVTARTSEAKSMNLSTLHSVGKLSSVQQPIEAAIEFVHAMLKQLLKIHLMVADLYDAGTGKFLRRIVAGGPIAQAVTGDGESPACRAYVERLLQSQETLIVPDLRHVLEENGGRFHEARSSLFVPLITHGHQHGVLHVHAPSPHAFGEEEAKMLYTIASQLATHIENFGLIQEIRRLLASCVEGFCTALEFKDNETEGHCQRVARYAQEVAQRMGIPSKDLESIREGALLHDIGKIGVPDAILRKPGKLTDAEMAVMKRHPDYGYRMLKDIGFPDAVTSILLQHHERYDGKGYPAGLKGEAILIGARVFTVVDTYDAIRSDRPYRKGTGYEAALAELKRCAGTQFDPDVVAVFSSIPAFHLEHIRQEVDEVLQSRELHQIIHSPG